MKISYRFLNINYPTISKDKTNKYFITFYLNKQRYRLYSSKKIGGTNHPNKFSGQEQIKKIHLLAAEVYNYFNNGGEILNEKNKIYK